MNKSNLRNLFLISFFLITTITKAQNITGKVVDQEKTPLEFVSVAVLKATDSTLVSYTTTNSKGEFKLLNVSKGKRIFQLNLLGYSVHQKNIDFREKSLNMGTITLKEEDNTLDEVVIKAIIPVVAKKDTMAFNTKAFKVRVDDTVEDLLKKLPGVEVDANGKVKAHGEEVSKVYVDGKEFFGGTPAIALKNLSADAIKKVEVIDEKSDKARVTGVGDSDRSKVINLKLKDDRKVNDFGKFQGGYGTENRYLTSLNYNRFSPKIQASIIGKFNNINSSSDDISNIMSFGGSGGSFTISRGGSGGSSSGFITTGSGGLNLGYELKKKQNLNSDYFYNFTNSRSGKVFSKRTEFVGSDKLYSESKSESESETKSHKANFSFIDRSNKLRTILIRGNINTSKTIGNSTSSFDGFDTNNVKDVSNINLSNSNNNSTSGRVNADYIQRFSEKSKRNILLRLNYSSNKSNGTNNNNNTKTYTDPLQIDELVNSAQKQNNKSNNIDLRVQYTEPLSEKHFLEFEAKFNSKNNNNFTDQTQNLNGTINSATTFTVDLFEKRKISSGALSYKYNTQKSNLKIGAEIQENIQNFGLTNISKFNKEYSALNPSVSFRYLPKRGSWLFFRYKKSLNLPSLNQVSPVINNFNPLYIKKGNQDLTAENRHSFFGMFGKHDFVSGFNFFSNINYSYTSNAIINKEDTDIATRVKTSSYINLGNKSNFNAGLDFGKRLKKLGVRYNLGFNHSISNYQSVINGVSNKTNSKNTSIKTSIENNKKDFLDVSLGANFSKNITSFSGTTINRDYFQQSYFVKSDWNITKSLNFSTQFKYDIFTDSNFGTDQAVPIWNASISYALLKSKGLNLKLTALDMLNKNVGFTRNSSDNYFEETTKEVLGTYFMFSLTYTLNGNKSKKGRFGGHGRMTRIHH